MTHVVCLLRKYAGRNKLAHEWMVIKHPKVPKVVIRRNSSLLREDRGGPAAPREGDLEGEWIMS